MAKKKAPPEFIEWLNFEINRKNWGLTEAARKMGISHPTLSEIMTHRSLPSFDTCVAIGLALGTTTEFVLRKAKMLPENDTFSEWNAAFAQLSPEDQAEMLAIAKIKLNKKQAAAAPEPQPTAKLKTGQSKA